MKLLRKLLRIKRKKRNNCFICEVSQNENDKLGMMNDKLIYARLENEAYTINFNLWFKTTSKKT